MSVFVRRPLMTLRNSAFEVSQSLVEKPAGVWSAHLWLHVLTEGLTGAL
jgi:hypothetical protein